jgi:FAD/FMN-containing dehydrogenase
MGGHAFRHGGVVLDMTRFNRMSLDPATKVLTVQTGATWHDIQSYLHPRFAVKAMQSTDIFTVGGSIAVNAHGMDHRAGSVGSTVRAMRVMLPDGSLREVSRDREPELFRLIVGGYGLFGIVLEADLDVVDNVLYASERRLVDYRDFPRLFREELAPDPTLGLMYGHLSTAPESFLAETMLFLYRQVDGPVDSLPPLKEAAQVRLRRLVFNLSKIGGPAMTLKWFAEKNVEPHVEACMPRQQALTDGCVVSRNEPMHDSVPYLRNSLRGETDILQEYFVPRDRFVAFVDESREILRRAGPTLMNYSVRVVHREDVALTYAREDAFAIVLYLNQRTDDAGNAAMRDLTRQMIDLSAKHGGTFFLPYQLHYTADQLRRAYPQIADVFAAKRRLDPDELLTNTWYETYRQ